MSLDKTLYPQLCTCSTKEDMNTSLHDLKIVDLDVKNQNKQTGSLFGTATTPLNTITDHKRLG